MKHLIFSIVICLAGLNAGTQSMPDLPEFKLQKVEMEGHLRYLASDELAGRRTGSEGGQMAARYLADQFSAYGLQPAPGAEDFFQTITFKKIVPPRTAKLDIEGMTYSQGDNFILFQGGETEIAADAVFAGFGWVDEATGHNDYEGLDVSGKIVFLLPGKPGGGSPIDNLKTMPEKQQIAMEHGAVGIIELYRNKYPWKFYRSYFTRERMEVSEPDNTANETFFYGVVSEGTPNPIGGMEAGTSKMVRFSTSGVQTNFVTASNVVGVVPGTDTALQDEYIIVSAHYDHVGVGSQGGAPYSKQDSIFNGARDNGMGTVALLAAAKSIAQKPARRPVLFLAVTGEEMGMIGSEYYVEHPLVPLEQTVFNLNNDGAGYNSTEHFTIIGLERTNVAAELEQAALNTGLTVAGDPAPEQNLYERSDNISFARKGIPAIDFAPGIVEMNEAVFKYYHQAIDNPETIDYDYLLIFSSAFAHATRLIADKKEPHSWTPGDKYSREK